MIVKENGFHHEKAIFTVFGKDRFRTMRETMEKALGLYVAISSDGRIIRDLVAHSGEVKLNTSTIYEEIIEFSKLNFKPYTEVVDLLQERFVSAVFEDPDEEHVGEMYL